MKSRKSKLKVDMRAPLNVARSLLSRVGIDRTYRKYFAIGFNKTATTSIDTVFNSAGYFSVHNTKWGQPGSNWWQYLYQAFSDGHPMHFRELDRRFPRSRFVLNTRDLDEWLDSRIEHIRHMISRNKHVENTGNWNINDESICAWVHSRNAHHLAVLDYFKNRPEDLLVINFIRDPNAAQKLSAFIGGKPVASKPHTRPIHKTREIGTLSNAEMIARCLQSLGVPETDRKFDIFCPTLEVAHIQKKWPSDTSKLA